MKPLSEMKHNDIKDIKLIVFDVDGVLVPRGTKISQESGITTLETKQIPVENISLIRKLSELGYELNINSGRGLYMLQEMFRPVLDFISLTYENGSSTWYEGRIIQHVNSFKYLKDIIFELQKVKDERIKGFEPKEFIITIHCHEQIKEIEDIVAKYPNLYTKWNGEAYDVGVVDIQTKGVGVKDISRELGLDKHHVLAIGDNYNDIELLENAGVKISADKTRLEGDFFVPLEGEHLPAKMLMEKIIELSQ